MKALLVFGVIGAALFSTQASAAYYYGTCPTCTGGFTGVSWRTAAANVANYYGAAALDLIHMCKNGGGSPMTAAIAEYRVLYSPAGGPNDVQWTYTQGYIDADCADLGFE